MVQKSVLNYFPKSMRANVVYATAEDCGCGYKFYNISYKYEDTTIHFTADGVSELKWQISKLKDGLISVLHDLEIE